MNLVVYKCPNCNADIRVGEDNNIIMYCPFCRAEIHKEENVERKEIKIDKNININRIYTDEAKIKEIQADIEKNKSENKALIIRGIIAIFLILIITPIGFSVKKVRDGMVKEGYISAGFYNDYIGLNYETVVKQFEARGFTNIETVHNNDKNPFNNGDVSSVSVNGVSSFDSFNLFRKDARVIIEYK